MAPSDLFRRLTRLWYATYCVVGLGIVLLSVVYYFAWMVVLPRWGGYEILQETVTLDGGALTNRFRKVPQHEVAHDRRRVNEDTAPLLST